MTIERIFIRPPSSKSQIECEQVTLVAGEGIEGDRYFGHHDEPGQNVTLVEAEVIEAFCAAHGLARDLSLSKRNLITRGVRLNDLVGREFMIGEVKYRGVQLCEPCSALGQSLATTELSADEVVRRLVHKAGLRADVLSGGVVKRGAIITLFA